jgi:two-component system cell cycle sensor histidine kinase/response regulator CckA
MNSGAAHSEDHYHHLFDINPEPLWVFDRNTLRFLAVNQAAVERYGYTREEFSRMSILDLHLPEDIVRVLRAGNPERCTTGGMHWGHRTKKGELLEVEISTRHLRWEGVDATLASVHDVTEAIRSAESLCQSEEKFSRAFRSSPVAMTISTKDEGRYIDVNEAFLHLIERPRLGVIGYSSRQLHVWDDVADRAKIIAELDRTGKATSIETIFVSRSGSRKTVQVQAELIVLEGKQCVLAIINDVTDARVMESQLRQAQKMDAIGQLAGGVAHDFNNMVGVIIGYCEVAQDHEEITDLLDDVEQIRKAAQKAATLTRQLLAFSRRQPVKPAVLNLNTAFKDLLQMLSRVIPANIELRFTCDPALWSIKADPGQIEQIILNLVVNARDAILTEGKIILETRNVELDDVFAKANPGVQPGPYVMLSVTDTGCGMDAPTVSRIFEPFFTTKSPGEGTGLGLSIVYGAMLQAGGHLNVHSEEGSGTTFELYFPRFEGQEVLRKAKRHEPALTRGSETILLVEDEQGFREITRELLDRSGYNVITAPDGQVAISQAAEHKIDALVTDMVLPGMSGRDVAEQISHSQPNLKVLYMSGYPANFIADQDLLRPRGSLLEKPFTRDVLLSQLRHLLEGEPEGALREHSSSG